MNNNNAGVSLSIMDLPAILTRLFKRANHPLLQDSKETPLHGNSVTRLFVRYLRRKAGRGLAIIYTVDEVKTSGHRTISHKALARNPKRSVSLTLEETALDGSQIRFSASQAEQAALQVQTSGVIRVDELGLSVQAFPADSSLPTLTTSCDTTQDGILFQALQSSAQVQLGDRTWRLISASAEPVRYKPANRCVIRYPLILDNSDTSLRREMTIFGKVYADPEQARSVQNLQQQLYDEQMRRGQIAPILPRPLGIIDTLGLTLNEAVQPNNQDMQNVHGSENLLGDHKGPFMRTGTQALQPRLERGRGGEITNVVLPNEELRLTGRALAGLHTSTIRPPEDTLRVGAKEAKRARERASLIAGRNPFQAEEVHKLAKQLSARLESLQPEIYRPAHGGFKSSQLLFHSHQVFVVDFDGFCLADAALDVGYFLAYLRPSGLWYQRSGMRQWFEAAAVLFSDGYREAMLEYGVTPASIEGIAERSKLYEAALLFKIATRRVNRLNSPRPAELSAILSEIAACLSENARRS